ncbi:MAG: MerR family transcriptional regulator [Eubacteriales bacterium]
MKQYFKIGEIAKLYNIGQDSLRYYEEIGILQPTRGENNYRLYRIEDIWQLNVIRELRGLGFSMERIGVYLKKRNVQETKAMIYEELEVIEVKIQQLELLRKNAMERLDTIEACYEHDFDQIEDVYIAERRCHIIESEYQKDEEMDVLIKKLLNYNPEHLYIIGSNRLGSIISLERANEGKCRSYTHVFVVSEDGEHEIQKGQYLTLRYRGLTNKNFKYIPMLLAHARDHGYEILSDIYEILWIDIHTSQDSSEHVNELQIRVEKRKR